MELVELLPALGMAAVMASLWVYHQVTSRARARRRDGWDGAPIADLYVENGQVRATVHLHPHGVDGHIAPHAAVRAGIPRAAPGLRVVAGQVHGSLLTGDLRLDGRVVLTADDPLAALAALDATTRHRLAEGVAQGVSVEDGAVVWRPPGVDRSPEVYASMAKHVGRIAASLRGCDDPVGALVARVAEDPVPGARRAAVGALAEHAPDRVLDALRDALLRCSPADAAALIQAAGAPGERAAYALVVDSATAPRVKSAALPFAERQLTDADVLGLIDDGPAVALVALRLVRARKLKVPAARLSALLGGAAPVAALALELVPTACPDLPEEALIGALSHPDGDVVAAACAALGARGTVAAVMPLREVETWLTKPAARAAARHAIAAIQHRGGGTTGALAVADDEVAGGLSLPREQGALSTVPRRPGQRDEA